MARRPKSKDSPLIYSLTVRVDAMGMKVLKDAADLHRMNVSDYVRDMALAQARRDDEPGHNHAISFTLAEPQAFWHALQQTRPLTSKQRELGQLMRGE